MPVEVFAADTKPNPRTKNLNAVMTNWVNTNSLKNNETNGSSINALLTIEESIHIPNAFHFSVAESQSATKEECISGISYITDNMLTRLAEIASSIVNTVKLDDVQRSLKKPILPHLKYNTLSDFNDVLSLVPFSNAEENLITNKESQIRIGKILLNQDFGFID